MNSHILEMKSITKEFPGVKALDEVSFAVTKGEIHCLVGENGAGKSTLMKVLSGVYPYGEYTVKSISMELNKNFRELAIVKRRG
jgi:putative multiple sugar transport system ATP-binding protein